MTCRRGCSVRRAGWLPYAPLIIALLVSGIAGVIVLARGATAPTESEPRPVPADTTISAERPAVQL
jgi:hypothetical protein